MSFLDANELLWPSREDRLLRESKNWDKAVTFSKHSIERSADIWGGYMLAGAALVDLSDSEPHTRNELIYPILYSYRHGLESAMKWMVFNYGSYVGVASPKPNHDLWQLWASCKKIFCGIGKDGGSGTLKAVENIVKEFHDLDENALSFRYSRDKDGHLIPLPDMEIDLANLKNVMKGISNFFDGADAQLDDFISAADYFAGDA